MVNEFIEEWKHVVGFEGWYEVSDLGGIRRIKSGKSTKIGRVLKPFYNPFGYTCVALSVDGKRYMRFVHVLVAEAFLGRRPDGMQVNHIDGVKSNPAIHNLEYVTRSQNAIHALNTGLWTHQMKLSRSEVAHIRHLAHIKSQSAIAKQFGIHQSQVSRIISGKRRSLTA